ncbi:MAG: hypothetical protein K8T90_15970, partial [Planctomycetes bacterium]|nr:hypothetical protein [Planctomycetota bacterium]
MQRRASLRCTPIRGAFARRHTVLDEIRGADRKAFASGPYETVRGTVSPTRRSVGFVKPRKGPNAAGGQSSTTGLIQ